jgi:hypothetical protein
VVKKCLEGYTTPKLLYNFLLKYKKENNISDLNTHLQGLSLSEDNDSIINRPNNGRKTLFELFKFGIENTGSNIDYTLFLTALQNGASYEDLLNMAQGSRGDINGASISRNQLQEPLLHTSINISNLNQTNTNSLVNMISNCFSWICNLFNTRQARNIDRLRYITH